MTKIYTVWEANDDAAVTDGKIFQNDEQDVFTAKSLEKDKTDRILHSRRRFKMLTDIVLGNATDKVSMKYIVF